MMNKETPEARCGNCQFFDPDTIGFGVGLGRCQKPEDFKATGASVEKVAIAFRRLGNELFWGGLYGRPRICHEFKAVSDK